MRKILLIAISGVSFCTMPAQAQFNTIAKTPERYKVEALQEGMKKPEPTPESMAPVQETSTKPADESKKLWIDRYLSVSYPLQRIRITSPYGYRKDPFTGKRKFHGGIDLHARGEQVLAMMEGVVVKVGHRTKYRRALAHNLQAKWQECRSVGRFRLHPDYTAGVHFSFEQTVVRVFMSPNANRKECH